MMFNNKKAVLSCCTVIFLPRDRDESPDPLGRLPDGGLTGLSGDLAKELLGVEAAGESLELAGLRENMSLNDVNDLSSSPRI